ncbi:MAG: hypothetical protein ACRC92_18675 [Peptostreptococcaceae bacterium]
MDKVVSFPLEQVEKVFKLVNEYGLVTFLVILISFVLIKTVGGLVSAVNQGNTLTTILQEVREIDRKMVAYEKVIQETNSKVETLGKSHNKLKELVDVLYADYLDRKEEKMK